MGLYLKNIQVLSIKNKLFYIFVKKQINCIN